MSGQVYGRVGSPRELPNFVSEDGCELMWFWLLLILLAVTTLWRFPALRRHCGIAEALMLSTLRLLALVTIALLTSPLSFPVTRSVRISPRIAVLLDTSQSVNRKAWQQAVQALLPIWRAHPKAISLWLFGSDLRNLAPSHPLPQPVAIQSRLSDAVFRLTETVRPDWLILIADGQDTDPIPDERVLAALRRNGTKIVAVPLPANMPPNLSVSVFPSQVTLFAGEEATITVTVRTQNFSGTAYVPMRIWLGKRLISQTRLRLTSRPMVTQTIRLRPNAPGWQRYRVEVGALAGERWTDDNAVTVTVGQSPTKLRLLLFTNQPTFEFKFVKQSFEREPNFEWVAMTTLPDGTRYQQGNPSLTPASLTRLQPFHVLVVLAPTPADFGAAEVQAIQTFVQNGGGLLLTLSPVTVASQGWRLFWAAPLHATPLPSPAPLVPVPDDLLGKQLSALPSAPAVWALTTQTPTSVALKSRGEPVLLWRSVGLGKVAILGIDGTWHWVMDAARKGEPPIAHQTFWRKLVRFLAEPKLPSQSATETQLRPYRQPPAEWTTPPNPDRLARWAKQTQGTVIKPEQLGAQIASVMATKETLVTERRPLSHSPLPYLLLIALFTIEWWLIRRKGLP